MNRGTYENPTRCSCKICAKYKWSHLPWWVHTPFELYRVFREGAIYTFTREEFKEFITPGAPLGTIDRLPASGRTRMMDQVQGGYRDWDTWWTIDVIDPKKPRLRAHTPQQMEEEDQFGMNYNFDDEADGVFPIEFRKNGRLLTKDGIWITK